MAYINGEETMFSANIKTNLTVDEIRDLCFPIGMTVHCDTSPAQIVGGVWEQIKDRFILAAGNTYKVGTVGGEAMHTLTVNEMPSHTHQIRGWAVNVGSGTTQYSPTMPDDNNYNNYLGYAMETGGSQAHNNMPPYTAENTWKRIA